jgi:hypothetical protein
MKVAVAKAVALGEHLAEGCSLKGTARLVKCVRAPAATAILLVGLGIVIDAKAGHHPQYLNQWSAECLIAWRGEGHQMQPGDLRVHLN